ncbi:ladderlectin-like [Centroberyx affinis]|uniref:ladderlectin-like n=1 Tax=Centroberyx affinis TaxID=166261 RepID=UPI003A5B94BF
MKILTVSLLLCAMMALTTGLVSVVDTASECPNGWTLLNHRCFLYVPQQMTWAEAENHCVSLGGHLASINSDHDVKAVQDMIKRITHKYPTNWLGGTDAKKESVWHDGQPFNYQFWSRGNPDNKGKRQHCLVMNYGVWCCPGGLGYRPLSGAWRVLGGSGVLNGKKRWDHLSCSTKHLFLCTRSLWDPVS